MNTRISLAVLVTILVALPSTAHAQYVPLWLIAGVLSPILVIVMAILLALLMRSVRIGITHVSFVLLWVLLFSLASYFVENDYVIWTPLALYILHAALLLVLLVMQIFKLFAANKKP